MIINQKLMKFFKDILDEIEIKIKKDNKIQKKFEAIVKNQIKKYNLL